MKKIIFLIIVVLLVLVTACSNSVDARDNEIESLIETAETEDEFSVILTKYNSPKDQIRVVKSKKYVGQKVLIQSDILAVEAFIEMCKNNEFNIEESNVVEWFKNAIEKFNLTEEQQIEIIDTDEYILHKLLLESSQLTPEAYVRICTSNKLNVNNPTIKQLYKKKFESFNFTSEQRKKIINIQELLFQEFIIKSDELTGEELVMICQDNQFDLKNISVEKMFEEAIEKTELNSHQQVAIAHIDEYVYHRAIILKTDISYEALLCLARNCKFDLDNSETIQWFVDAVNRVNPTEKQKNTLLLAKNKIIQDILI